MSRRSAALPPAAPQDAAAPAQTDDAAGSNPKASGAERRAHRRHTVSEVGFITKVRLKYGPAVTLIDLSTGGIQVETINFRLQPGSVAVVELVGRDAEVSMPAQVLRCQLVSLLPEPVYRGALVFKRSLDFAALGQEGGPAVAPPELNPALEQASLNRVLKRVLLSGAEPTDAALKTLASAVAAAFATLDTPAGKRAGSALSGELAALFRAVADAIEQQPTPRTLVTAIEEHLRQVVPARAIRMADADGPMPIPGSEAILLSVPELGSGGGGGRVAVEFADGCEPLELHFQLLKAGMPLVALARELGRLNGFERPLGVQKPQKLPAGWSRIVVRYNSGDVHKGFTHNFLPTKGFVHLMPEPVVSPDNRVAVPFTDLKAIFFVKDHDGNPAYDEDRRIDPATRGRKVAVRFRDGEELVGTTVNYSSGAPGFFVQPADPQSNNERIFVVARAIGALKFL